MAMAFFFLHIYKARSENLKVKYYRLPKPHQVGLTYPLQVWLVPWSKSLVSATLEMSLIPKHIAHDPASALPEPMFSRTFHALLAATSPGLLHFLYVQGS